MGFVTCAWSCSKCQRSGTIKPWRRDNETREETALRQQQETRSSCVAGCPFVADAKWNAPKGQPEDGTT